jgi:hypothetical protein
MSANTDYETTLDEDLADEALDERHGAKYTCGRCFKRTVTSPSSVLSAGRLWKGRAICVLF